MASDFKAFLTKTNALALAIGVIIGAALGSVVNSLVKDIIMPPIGWLLGGVDFATLAIALPEKDGKTVTINYGVVHQQPDHVPRRGARGLLDREDVHPRGSGGADEGLPVLPRGERRRRDEVQVLRERDLTEIRAI